MGQAGKYVKNKGKVVPIWTRHKAKCANKGIAPLLNLGTRRRVSNSHPGPFSLGGGGGSGSYWIGIWMGPRASDTLEKREVSWCYPQSNHDSSVVLLAAMSLYITLKAEGACSSKRSVFMSKHSRCQNPKDHHLTNDDFLTTQKFKVTSYRDVQMEGKTEARVVQ
jgi:hypothetical protein